jgi:hypothetical protein
MRIAVALAFLAGVLLTAGQASAAPLALGDHAALSREAAKSVTESVSYRAKARRHYQRYAYAGRRYDWTYRPYWRPYQYRYWQFYYPYGGPLF